MHFPKNVHLFKIWGISHLINFNLMKSKKFDFKNKVLIIAEIGNNHEGSFKLAKKLIEKASKAGVDAVKFQTFKTEKFVNDIDQLRYKRLKKFELSKEDFYKLSKFAKSKKLIFISTPLDIQSAIDLNKCVDYFKISSGERNNKSIKKNSTLDIQDADYEELE